MFVAASVYCGCCCHCLLLRLLMFAAVVAGLLRCSSFPLQLLVSLWPVGSNLILRTFFCGWTSTITMQTPLDNDSRIWLACVLCFWSFPFPPEPSVYFFRQALSLSYLLFFLQRPWFWNAASYRKRDQRMSPIGDFQDWFHQPWVFFEENAVTKRDFDRVTYS